MRKRIALLGATGSIGASASDVLLRHPDRFEAVALSAHRDVAGAVARCKLLRPRHAAIADPALLDALARGLREAGLATDAPDEALLVPRGPELDLEPAEVGG